VPGEFQVGSVVLALVKGRPGRIATQAAVLIAVIGASVIYSSVEKTVNLSVDGKTSQVHVFTKTVGGLLSHEGIHTGPRDLVSPSLATGLGRGDTVVVRYARPLTVTVNGQKRVYWTTQDSVDKAMTQLGLRADGAMMSVSRSEQIDRGGLAFWMSTPKHVTLVDGGRKEQLTTAAPTVSALLTAQDLEVSPLDKLSAVPSQALTEGMTIKLTRVTQKQQTKTEKVPFAITRTKTAKLSLGTVKVTRKGVEGSARAVYALTLTDGKVTRKALVTQTVLTKPVTQVEQVGTKKKSAPKAASSGSVSGKKAGGSLNWGALAQCESGGNPRASNGVDFGLYQFSLGTWHSVGGSGNPINASSSEQTSRAQILYGRTGASSWPTCGPKLFT
jgi:uncharacterized protein YabE (DUF348 family)